MQLFYSPNSPYARKCRVLVIEKGLESQVKFKETDPHASPAELLAVNPLSGVPALVTKEGGCIVDSPIICEYLDALPSNMPPFFPEKKSERFAVLALAGLADGMIDAAVELILQRRRPEEKQWPDRIERREQAIMRTIDVISRHSLPGDAMLNIGTLTLACALAYLHFRHPHLQWEHSHPELDTWLAHVLKRPGFEATQPVG